MINIFYFVQFLIILLFLETYELIKSIKNLTLIHFAQIKYTEMFIIIDLCLTKYILKMVLL